MGRTGNVNSGGQLHFEVWIDGVVVNPLDFLDGTESLTRRP